MVNNRVFEGIICVYILFEYKGKETLPRSPHSIIEHRQPISKENLPAESIVEGKVDFCEDKDDVLVEIVANHPTNSSISPSAMNKKQSN